MQPGVQLLASPWVRTEGLHTSLELYVQLTLMPVDLVIRLCVRQLNMGRIILDIAYKIYLQYFFCWFLHYSTMSFQCSLFRLTPADSDHMRRPRHPSKWLKRRRWLHRGPQCDVHVSAGVHDDGRWQRCHKDLHQQQHLEWHLASVPR